LKELTHENVKWKLNREAENPFDEIKRRLTDTASMADASLVGLGAVLQQRQDDRQYQPVYYANRKLRDPETRYS